MKRFIKLALPYLLSVIILAGGSGIALVSRSFLPDHIGDLTASDIDNAGAYYIESDSEIYPWNLLSGEDPSLNKWLSDRGLSDNAEAFSDFVNYYITLFSDGFAPKSYIYDTGEKLKVHKNDDAEYVYIKDLTYASVSGDARSASLVWKDNTLICIELDSQTNGDVSYKSNLAAAYLNDFREFMQNYKSNSDGELYKEKVQLTEEMLSLNPVFQALANIALIYEDNNSYMAYSAYNLLMYGSYYTINLDGKILLVMTNEYGTLILSFDPPAAAVTGFTININY